jgi:hypothetical protein
MNNLLSLQRELIKSSIPTIHNAEAADYVSFGSDLEELNAMSEVAAHVYSLTTDTVRRVAPTYKNLTFLDSPKEFKELAPVQVRIDAHVDGIQDTTECKVLIGFSKMLLEHKPFVFVRNEDPEQTDALVHIFENRSYQSHFFLETDAGGIRVSKIWLVGIHSEFAKQLNIDWELAKDTGHPSGDSPVRLVIH